MIKTSKAITKIRGLWSILSMLIWVQLCRLTLITSRVRSQSSRLRATKASSSSHPSSRCSVKMNNPIRPWRCHLSRGKSRAPSNKKSFRDLSTGAESLVTRESNMAQRVSETFLEADPPLHSVIDSSTPWAADPRFTNKRQTWEEAEMPVVPRTCQLAILK